MNRNEEAGAVLIESLMMLVLATSVLALILAADATLKRRKDAIEVERNREVARLSLEKTAP